MQSNYGGNKSPHPTQISAPLLVRLQLCAILKYDWQLFVARYVCGPEVESRTQGSRPRTQKNFEARDRPSRGQGLRTQAQVFSKTKEGFEKFFSSNLKKKFLQAKKVFKNFFSGDFHLRKTKKGLRKFSARFLALSNKISTVQKIVLSSSGGQGDFRELEASRPRTSKCVLEAKDVLEDYTSAVAHNR